MPVVWADVAELLDVVKRHVPASRLPALLADLTTTQAYRHNASYRATIDRMTVAERNGR